MLAGKMYARLPISALSSATAVSIATTSANVGLAAAKDVGALMPDVFFMPVGWPDEPEPCNAPLSIASAMPVDRSLRTWFSISSDDFITIKRAKSVTDLNVFGDLVT